MRSEEPLLAYPATPAGEEVHRIGDLAVPDPYRWLEGDGEAVGAWEDEQDRLARKHLEGWEGFGAARELLASLALPAPPSAARDLPLDLAAESARAGQPLAVDQVVPSRDGRFVAVAVSPAGSEQSTLRIIELATGSEQPAHLPFASRSIVAWLPDSSGLYYSAGIGPETETMQRCVQLYRLGDEGPTTVAVDLRGRTWVAPQLSATHVAIVVYEGNFIPRPWYLRRLGDPEDAWQPFLVDGPDMVHGMFVGEEYVAVVVDGEGFGRVCAIPLTSQPDPSTWREILPEGDLVLRGVRSLGGDRLLVSALRDGDPVAVVVTLDGTVLAQVTPPSPGAAVFPVPEHPMPLSSTTAGDGPAPDRVSFTHSVVHRSPAPFALDLGSGALEQVGERVIDLDGQVAWERRTATSSDGRAVPYDLFRPHDADPSRPAPTLLYGYGGFNLPIHRDYDPLKAAWLRSGGTLVIPHLRGGGEYGWPWWHQGRLERKQQTFDDLYAVAEALLADGTATREQLGLYGMSNGGLLGAVAVSQRPDLFAAVAVLVPVCDLLRIGRDPWGAFRCEPEYGDPADPVEAAWMAAYSPYHHLEPGVRRPATLVVSADADSRTYPWHARKYAAALQAAGSDRPALLLTIRDAGHFAALDPANEHLWLSFLMQHTGLTPAPPITHTRS